MTHNQELKLYAAMIVLVAVVSLALWPRKAPEVPATAQEQARLEWFDAGMKRRGKD